jgi:hypothetical protein
VSKELETIVLGDEHDDALRDALRIVLVSCGAVGVDASWAVGGSQEVETIQIKLGSDLVTIESETFVGLTISGPKLVIDDIAKQVRRQLGL